MRMLLMTLIPLALLTTACPAKSPGSEVEEVDASNANVVIKGEHAVIPEARPANANAIGVADPNAQARLHAHPGQPLPPQQGNLPHDQNQPHHAHPAQMARPGQ